MPENLNADDEGMSHSETREKTLDGLILSMRGNMANLRSKLTDVEAIHLELEAQEEVLNMAMGESEDAKNQLREFREEMEAAFKLTDRKPQWNGAIECFLTAALGHDKAHPATTPKLCEYLTEILQMAEGEHMKQNSLAFVGFHPAEHSMLKVFYATEGSELRMGQTLRENSTEPSAIAARKVSEHAGEHEPSTSTRERMAHTEPSHLSLLLARSLCDSLHSAHMHYTRHALIHDMRIHG